MRGGRGVGRISSRGRGFQRDTSGEVIDPQFRAAWNDAARRAKFSISRKHIRRVRNVDGTMEQTCWLLEARWKMAADFGGD